MFDSALSQSDIGEQRLRFLTLHLHDLQSIRWAPLWIFLIYAAFAFSLNYGPFPVRFAACAALLAEPLWFWYVTRHMRQTYGRAKLTAAERLRLRFPSRIVMLFTVVFFIVWIGLDILYRLHRPRNQDWLIGCLIVLVLLRKITDKTNPPIRRNAYAAGLLVLLIGVPLLFLIGQDLSPWSLVLLGSVFLFLGIFDFILLERTAASPVIQPAEKV
jgi:hypothetical protein